VFSPDGQLFATAQWAKKQDQIQFWDTQNWQLVPVQWPDGKPRRFNFASRIAFSNAEKQEYFATADGSEVVLWRLFRETAIDGRIRTLRLEVLRHWRGSRCFDCAISPDGKLLAWVVKEQNENRPDTAGYRLRLWDIGKQHDIESTVPRLLQEWHALAIFPDSSQRLVFIGESKQAEVWGLPLNQRLFDLGKAEPFIASHLALNKQNGKWFAGKIAPTEVVVWDMSRRKRMFALRPEATEIISLDWSPDGRRLALGRHDGQVVVWDLNRVNEELSRLGLDWSDGDL
jgi:WD40 repeat protein